MTSEAAVYLFLPQHKYTVASLYGATVLLIFFHLHKKRETIMNIDITKIWPGWTITERLGHGGFGHVYKATFAVTDSVASVKVITIPDNPDIIKDLRYSGRSDDEILAMCHEETEYMIE